MGTSLGLDLGLSLLEAGDNEVLWESSLGSPEAVTSQLTGSGAAMMNPAGDMTLPAVSEKVLANASSKEELGQQLANKAPVTRYTIKRKGPNLEVHAKVNPDTVVLVIMAAVWLALLMKVINEYRDRFVDEPGQSFPPNTGLEMLPMLPEEHRYARRDSGFQAQRRSKSPARGLRTRRTSLPGGRVSTSTDVVDPPSATGRRSIGRNTQVAPSAGSASRNYPMTNDDYEIVGGGERMGRGHLTDHADGSDTTTADPENYTPQTQVFNEGGRNHGVRGLRSNGGTYSENDRYPPTPQRTNDGTAVPSRIGFQTVSSSGARSTYDIPNNATDYGSSRSMAQLNTHAAPHSTMEPPVVDEPRVSRFIAWLLLFGIATVAMIWALL